MNKAWKFCDNCQQWRYLITVNERTFCETCKCAPGQKDDAETFTPPPRQERDWRILQWAARWGGDLMDDTFAVREVASGA